MSLRQYIELIKDFYITKLTVIQWINGIAAVAMFCCALLLTMGLFVPLICTVQVLR